MLTVVEAARALGISPASVRVLLRRGVLPHHRPTPHRVVIAEADVAAHLARTRCEVSPEPSPKPATPRRYQCHYLGSSRRPRRVPPSAR